MRKNKYRQSPNFAHNSFLKTGRNSSNRLTCYRGADKSLARPGRKQATATEDVDVHIFFYNHNRRNISTIYIYNKTSIKRNILIIKQNTSGIRSG